MTGLAAMLLLLAGCGADGAPERPPTGIDDGLRVDVSGTASIGVSGRR